MATVDPGGPMMRRLRTALLAVLFLVPALPAVAVTRPAPPRLPPNAVSPLPSYVRRMEPAVVGLRVKARADAPSSQRLGDRRAGSGVIFDTRGYAVTVSYLVVDAQRIEAQLRDGRTGAAQFVGVDLATGHPGGRLAGEGPPASWWTASTTPGPRARPASGAATASSAWTACAWPRRRSSTSGCGGGRPATPSRWPCAAARPSA